MAPNQIVTTIITSVVVLFHAACATTVLLTLSYAVWYGEAPLELSSLKHAQQQSVQSSEVTDTSTKTRVVTTDTSTNVGTALGKTSGTGEETKKRRARNKGSSSEQSATCLQGCCEIDWGGAYDTTLLKCANSTSHYSPPTCTEEGTKDATRSPRVAVVTMITSEITWWAKFSAAINAEWACQKGYQFVVVDDSHYSQAQAAPNTDQRFGKVLAVRAMLARDDVDLVLWMDADAVVVDPNWDVVSLATQHPGKELIVCREANLETNNVVNSGTMIVRSSEWAEAFLERWYAHPTVVQGAPDQYVFDRLWEANALDLQQHAAVLPATVFNSEPPWYDTWQSPRQQPIIHLMGDHGLARRRVFERMFRGLCAAR
eukprot:CAMPEP_0118954932 /NCGR_PEP_ID=MMETSP1169-20130426/59178_1 /TAXON_ID=36882 /ORGANISM="Pyramimonas obovata, Strain CCMP722" /LENGTH=371 /DNA_ID=CAMNT_0006902679 /DNA_START=162 /DNA_END=1274 /DNA_ORIENTATION=+